MSRAFEKPSQETLASVRGMLSKTVNLTASVQKSKEGKVYAEEYSSDRDRSSHTRIKVNPTLSAPQNPFAELMGTCEELDRIEGELVSHSSNNYQAARILNKFSEAADQKKQKWQKAAGREEPSAWSVELAQHYETLSDRSAGIARTLSGGVKVG